MAVPGSVFSRLSAGPNGLLRAGAAPVLSAGDVLAVLGLAAPEHAEAEPEFLRHVPGGSSSTVDELAARSGLPVARLLELLLELELGGWLARDADGRYRRSHSG
jgi:DNA processing protein